MATSRVNMADARHPKPYPRGPKHPKLSVNKQWKKRVDEALEANARSGRRPRSRKELARLIRADPAGLNRVLDGDQGSYKYAKQISELLAIPPAQVDNPELSDGPIQEDEWSRTVAAAKSLPESEQRKLLRMFRAALDALSDLD